VDARNKAGLLATLIDDESDATVAQIRAEATRQSHEATEIADRRRVKFEDVATGDEWREGVARGKAALNVRD